ACGRTAADGGAVAVAASSGEIFVHGRARRGQAPDLDFLRNETARAHACVPVIAGGTVVAVLSFVTTRPPGTLSEDDLAFFGEIAAWGSLASAPVAERALLPLRAATYP